MTENYQFIIKNPDFKSLGYIVAVANLNDKHDRSAPSDYHWKILKCRMVIFSNSSVLACPDKNELKRIHFIFSKIGADFDKLYSLFQKFSLLQEGEIRTPTPDLYQLCFQYTMTAKIAPLWNILGHNYLINNRDFLTATTPQDGLRYFITCDEEATKLSLKPMKINFIRSKEEAMPGELIRVLPSLNKAILEEVCETMPETMHFKSYKDLKRHWKNIHGYRLPETEGPYYMVRFWRGEPLTYPRVSVARDFPIVTPKPPHEEAVLLSRFLNCLKSKMPQILGKTLILNQTSYSTTPVRKGPAEKYPDSQAVSLCTPTQTFQKF